MTPTDCTSHRGLFALDTPSYQRHLGQRLVATQTTVRNSTCERSVSSHSPRSRVVILGDRWLCRHGDRRTRACLASSPQNPMSQYQEAGNNFSISDPPTKHLTRTLLFFQMHSGCWDCHLWTPCVRSFDFRAAVKMVRFCFCLFDAEGRLRAHVRTLRTSAARSRLSASHAFCTLSDCAHDEHHRCHSCSDHTDLAVSLASRSLLLVWLMVAACIASA